MTRLTTYANGDAEPTTTDDNSHAPSGEPRHDTEPTGPDSGSVRFEVFARESVPPDVAWRQRAFVARVRDHVAKTPAAELRVDTWAKQVAAPSADRVENRPLHSTARATYAAFERWAREHGYDLEPAFRRRTRVSLSGDARSVVVDLPVLCVAVYEDGDLRDVFPRSVDGDVRPVGDVFAVVDAGGVGPSHDAPAVDVKRSAGTRRDR